jgi:hypothetical protein
VECVYKNNGKKSLFGLASDDEMCMAFITVLGKIETTQCLNFFDGEKMRSLDYPELSQYASCPNQKAFPFSMNEKLLCDYFSELAKTNNTCFEKAENKPKFYVNKYCSNITPAPFSDVDLPICTQQKRVLVKTLTSAQLQYKQGFGSASQRYCPDTEAPDPDNDVILISGSVVLKSSTGGSFVLLLLLSILIYGQT